MRRLSVLVVLGAADLFSNNPTTGTIAGGTMAKGVNSTNISAPIDPAPIDPNQEADIPADAAGGLGAYLRQIASELSAEMGAKSLNDTSVDDITVSTDLVSDIPHGLAESPLNQNQLFGALKDTNNESSPPAKYFAIAGDGSHVPAADERTGRNAVRDRSGKGGSTAGTAAAAGGVLLLAGGACGLYARNKRMNGRAELSRFGSPHRSGGNELPRRFLPV